jgi:hypothetical protein
MYLVHSPESVIIPSTLGSFTPCLSKQVHVCHNTIHTHTHTHTHIRVCMSHICLYNGAYINETIIQRPFAVLISPTLGTNQLHMCRLFGAMNCPVLHRTAHTSDIAILIRQYKHRTSTNHLPPRSSHLFSTKLHTSLA